MSTKLAPVTRPNGKIYKPREGLTARRIDHPDEIYLYVFRTHDIDQAHEFGSRFEHIDKDSAELMWVRLAMRNGEPHYIHDEVRGMPAVAFSFE